MKMAVLAILHKIEFAFSAGTEFQFYSGSFRTIGIWAWLSALVGIGEGLINFFAKTN